MKNEFADLNNIAKAGTGAGSCVAAGFLKVYMLNYYIVFHS